RFPGPAQLTCWAGLTPFHHESDTTVHRGRITKQGSCLVRWVAIESVKILRNPSHIGGIREKVAQRRGNRNIGAVAAARNSSNSSTTGYGVTTSAACTAHRARREHTIHGRRGSCRS